MWFTIVFSFENDIGLTNHTPTHLFLEGQECGMGPERTATWILHTDAPEVLGNHLDGRHHVVHYLVRQQELGTVLLLWESKWKCLGPAPRAHDQRLTITNSLYISQGIRSLF